MKKRKSFTQRHFSEKTGAGFTPTPLSKSKKGGKGLPSTIFFTKNGAGFTLIEILVVIAIVGILASVVTVVALKVREKARIVAALQFSSTIHNVLGAYLVGEWKFEEGGNDTCPTSDPTYNDVCDTSGENNHGSWSGSWKCTEDDTPSRKGCSLEFNGTGDYVYIGGPVTALNLGGQNATWTGWFYQHQMTQTANTIIGKDFVEEWEIFTYSSGTPGSGDIRLDTPQSHWVYNVFSDNEWVHFVFTYKDGTVKAYINSVLKETWTGRDPIASDNNSVYIGKSARGPWYYFDGLIDEVRIFNEALSSAQIKKLYAEGAERHGLLAKE